MADRGREFIFVQKTIRLNVINKNVQSSIDKQFMNSDK